MKKSLLLLTGLLATGTAITPVLAQKVSDQSIHSLDNIDLTISCWDLGTITFLDSNHPVKDDKNVSESESMAATKAITQTIKLGIAYHIPGAELEKDYTIDSSQIKPGDLSRGAEVFINAKKGSTLIKEGTYTSAWMLFINI